MVCPGAERKPGSKETADSLEVVLRDPLDTVLNPALDNPRRWGRMAESLQQDAW